VSGSVGDATSECRFGLADFLDDLLHDGYEVFPLIVVAVPGVVAIALHDEDPDGCPSRVNSACIPLMLAQSTYPRSVATTSYSGRSDSKDHHDLAPPLASAP
jgi:hypothetical protein